MTVEKAIWIMKAIKEYADMTEVIDECSIAIEEISDATSMAIEALKNSEFSNNSDCISRQAAIESLYKEIIKRRLLDDVNDGMLDEFDTEDILRKLKPADVQPVVHWIPCSERLPEESGRYLISVLDGIGRRTTVAPYQPRYKAWTMTGRMAYWKVVAWMPLPEPYHDKRKGADE